MCKQFFMQMIIIVDIFYIWIIYMLTPDRQKFTASDAKVNSLWLSLNISLDINDYSIMVMNKKTVVQVRFF